MAGMREKKRRGLRLPATVMLLTAASLLLSSGAPSGVAVNSPAESEGPVQEIVLPAAEPVTPAAPLTEAPAVPEELDLLQEPAGPVHESLPVEDTYFEQVAFLGDSRTEGFKIYSGLKEGKYYYAVGATVESVFTKAVETKAGEMPLLDAMAKAEFDKIYVLLGVNELGWKGTDLYRDQYGRLIDRLRRDHPDAEIVLQTNPPVSAKQNAKKGYVNNKRIAEYNEVIAALAEEKGCRYVDIAAVLVDEEGCLPTEWTPDGIHMNRKGYGVWLDYLRTHTLEGVPLEELPPEALPEENGDAPETPEELPGPENGSEVPESDAEQDLQIDLAS